MPNHVKSKLEVVGAKEKMLEVMSHLKGEPFEDGEERRVDFNKIKPMPDGLSITSDGWISLLENQFATHESLKTALDRQKGRPNFVYDDDTEKQMNNFMEGIKNYLKHGHASWYGWCCENWGTKWNAYSLGDDRDTETIVYFETAWSAPKELMRLLSEQFPDVKVCLLWADEDTGYNAGRMEFQAGKEVKKFEPAGGSKEAYDIAFEMRPDYQEGYELVDGQYQYIEEDD